MSHLIKLGAQAITDEAMADVSDEHKEKALTWHAGFYTGLYEAGMITNDELDDLTNKLRGHEVR